MAHATGHKPIHKPAPDIGWGTKISAVCVGAAGLAGAMMWGFSGPIVTPIANAAGSAAASTAAKVAEATGVTEGLMSLKDIGVQIGAVYGGDKIIEVSHHRFSSLGCTSMTDSPACFASGAGAVAGGLLIIFAAYVMCRIAKHHGQKYL